jgi:ubiquinone/menaquinone biosynthesis C-methylase UbiE
MMRCSPAQRVAGAILMTIGLITRRSEESVDSAYGNERVASGYAFDRPPVHEHIIRHVPPLGRRARGLDVGCGAGRSTAALCSIADSVVGLEPVPGMLAHSRQVAPSARFVIGRAEHLPFAARTFDLITAGGCLPYVDLDRFLPEAARVLTTDGVLVIYDFSEGRQAQGDDRLSKWFKTFEQHCRPQVDDTKAGRHNLANLHRKGG